MAPFQQFQVLLHKHIANVPRLLVFVLCSMISYHRFAAWYENEGKGNKKYIARSHVTFENFARAYTTNNCNIKKEEDCYAGTANLFWTINNFGLKVVFIFIF